MSHQTKQKKFKPTVKTIFTCKVINTFVELSIVKGTCHTCIAQKWNIIGMYPAILPQQWDISDFCCHNDGMPLSHFRSKETIGVYIWYIPFSWLWLSDISCHYCHKMYSRYIPLPWQLESYLSHCHGNMTGYISIIFYFWAIACMTCHLYFINLTNVFIT